MLNLFYIPPPNVPDKHPRTVGVRTVVKRNQPTRLEMMPPVVGVPLSGHYLPSHVPAVVDVVSQPVVTPVARRSLRARLGTLLVAWGETLLRGAKYPLGQPVR